MDIQLTDGKNADGNTAPPPVDSGEAAQVAAMHSEAQKGMKEFMASVSNPDKPETVQPSIIPTEPLKPTETKVGEAGDKVEVPKQFQAKDGSLDEEKILKSTQNQEQLNAKKRELLDKYKTLQREGSNLDKSIKEVKPTEQTPTVQAPQVPAIDNYLSADLTQEERDALEAAKSEPLVSAILKAQAALAKVTTDDIRRKVEMSEVQGREVSMLERLDALSKDNPWLYTEEGQGLVDQFLRDPKNQGLWQTDDPYGYAVERLAKQIAPQGTAAGQARPAGTPMLGVGKAIPPSSQEPVTPSQELEKLRQSVEYGNLTGAELRKAENELRNKARAIFSPR